MFSEDTLKSVQEEYWFDPHEYEGIVMDSVKESIPLALATSLKRLDSACLWQIQAFAHHDHPALRASELESEVELVEMWKHVLSNRFPTDCFIIERTPLSQVTWFQPWIGAPISDDETWELFVHGRKISIAQPLDIWHRIDKSESKEIVLDALQHSLEIQLRERSDTNVFEQSQVNFRDIGELRENPLHRGILEAFHIPTGLFLVLATRTIRDVVGELSPYIEIN